MVAYLHVVAEVYIIHQVVSVADAGSIAAKGSTADYHIFTDIVIVTDNQPAFFSRIVEILRFRSQDSILMYLVSFSHSSTLQDTCIRHDDAVITDFHILFNVGKRQNGYILAEFLRQNLHKLTD